MYVSCLNVPSGLGILSLSTIFQFGQKKLYDHFIYKPQWDEEQNSQLFQLL